MIRPQPVAAVGLTGSTSDSLDTQMDYVARTLDTADSLVLEVSNLRYPDDDRDRIDTILGYLAQSSDAGRSALDNYRRFGPASPGFQQDLDKAAELENQFSSAVKVYGITQCG
jgi:hypothetical protein